MSVLTVAVLKEKRLWFVVSVMTVVVLKEKGLWFVVSVLTVAVLKEKGLWFVVSVMTVVLNDYTEDCGFFFLSDMGFFRRSADFRRFRGPTGHF